MKAKTLQIVWHSREPVLSLDFHPPSGLLFTAGADKEIRVWSISRRGEASSRKQAAPGATQEAQPSAAQTTEAITAEHLFSFAHHNYAINVVRFSPSGDVFASGADGGEIALWRWVGVAEDALAIVGGTGHENPPEHSAAGMGLQSGDAVGGGPLGAASVSSLAQRQRPAGPFSFTATSKGKVQLQDAAEKLVRELGSKGWKAVRSLSRHERDVLDLAWSPDGAFLISGSVDNSAIIWDATRGCPEHFLQDHGHYVQGVAWDPLGAMVVTSSGDRSTRIYSVPFGAPPGLRPAPLTGSAKSGKARAAAAVKCVHTLHRREASSAEACALTSTSPVPASVCTSASPQVPPPPPGPESAEESSLAPPPSKQSSKVYLFHDESMPSFFRRGAWSPDGSLLVLPAGLAAADLSGAVSAPLDVADKGNTCFVFARADLTRPLAHLPALSKPTVVVRFSPVFYALRSGAADGDEPSLSTLAVPGGASPGAAAAWTESIKLPYSFVFAVASTNSIFIYSTTRAHPLAFIGGMHYAPISDMSWSHDGLLLAVSSQDGYCSVLSFEVGELGTPLALSGLPSHIQEAIPPFLKFRLQETEVDQGKAPGCTQDTLQSLGPSKPVTTPFVDQVRQVGNVMSGRKRGHAELALLQQRPSTGLLSTT